MLFYRPALPCPELAACAQPATSPPAGANQPAQGGYAVVDLETTGLSPARDQILEIGLVLTDPAGTVQRTWSTLVRPPAGTDGQIDVGPTQIHGLTATDLEQAPTLDEVADLLVADLAGRVVVAHNARFDLGFLTHALAARGYLDPGARVPRVCTMEWARHYLSVSSRRLVTCCQAAGVRIGQHHSALDDAQAAASLLRGYLTISRERGEAVPWSGSLAQAAAFYSWHWDDDAAARQVRRLTPR